MDKILKRGIIIALISGIFSLLVVIIPLVWDNPHNPDHFSPLTIISGNSWGGLTASTNNNSVVLNGEIDHAGFYFSTSLGTDLRNKTVILEIKNAHRRSFSNNAMLKITMNQDDALVQPLNISNLELREYVPFGYERVEFLVPSDFDGRLAFTFLRASLNNLEIALFYKE